jgi:hypothetical protein
LPRRDFGCPRDTAQADCGQIASLKDDISMIGAPARKLFGSANDRRIKVNAINLLEGEVAELPDEQLRIRTDAFKQQLEAGKTQVAAQSPLSRTTFQ